MSKTHLKTNNTKITLLAMIAIGFVVVALNIAIIIQGIISTNKPVDQIANPALVQQQTIIKAYDLLNDQTLPD